MTVCQEEVQEDISFCIFLSKKRNRQKLKKDEKTDKSWYKKKRKLDVEDAYC